MTDELPEHWDRDKPAVDITAGIILKVTGMPIKRAESTAEKLTPGEREELQAAYESCTGPRSVLQRAIDRITDEKIAAKAAEQEAESLT